MYDLTTDWLFHQAPIWLVAIIVFTLLMVAGEIGARTLPHGRGGLGDDSGQTGFVVSAVLGLLALLIGFTFSLAIERFVERQDMVIDEANAISGAYLMAQAFDQPHRGRMSELLARYVDNRLELGYVRGRAAADRLLAVSDELHVELWRETLAVARPSRDAVAASFMEAMGRVFDVAAAREAARRNHVPLQVFVALLVYMAVSAGVLGHALGTRRRASLGVFLGLLSLSYLLILDIDGPVRGGVVEMQTPMEDLKASLEALPQRLFAP